MEGSGNAVVRAWKAAQDQKMTQTGGRTSEHTLRTLALLPLEDVIFVIKFKLVSSHGGAQTQLLTHLGASSYDCVASR